MSKCKEHQLPSVYCEKCRDIDPSPYSYSHPLYTKLSRRLAEAESDNRATIREYAATIRALQYIATLGWGYKTAPEVASELACVQPDRWKDKGAGK